MASSQLEKKPVWDSDESTDTCTACGDKFTLINRRHHCRRCGKIFCTKCSNKKILLPEYGYNEAERVCDKCYQLQNETVSQKIASQKSIIGITESSKLTVQSSTRHDEVVQTEEIQKVDKEELIKKEEYEKAVQHEKEMKEKQEKEKLENERLETERIQKEKEASEKEQKLLLEQKEILEREKNETVKREEEIKLKQEQIKKQHDLEVQQEKERVEREQKEERTDKERKLKEQKTAETTPKQVKKQNENEWDEWEIEKPQPVAAVAIPQTPVVQTGNTVTEKDEDQVEEEKEDKVNTNDTQLASQIKAKNKIRRKKKPATPTQEYQSEFTIARQNTLSLEHQILAAKIKTWIKIVLSTNEKPYELFNSTGKTYQQYQNDELAELIDILDDGVVLVQLVHTLIPGSEKLFKIEKRNNAMSLASAIINISNFLMACRSLGIPENDLFDPNEFQQRIKTQQVTRTIKVFADECEKLVHSPALSGISRNRVTVDKYGFNKDQLM